MQTLISFLALADWALMFLLFCLLTQELGRYYEDD
jgi:hypothetical protein